jgi:hypothetical protein
VSNPCTIGDVVSTIGYDTVDEDVGIREEDDSSEELSAIGARGLGTAASTEVSGFGTNVLFILLRLNRPTLRRRADVGASPSMRCGRDGFSGFGTGIS